MTKTVLITGSTSGIGLEAAKTLFAAGHRVLLHGRSDHKISTAIAQLEATGGSGSIGSYSADLSLMSDVEKLAQEVQASEGPLDVLLNNAGILKSRETTTADGIDIRFAVNTLAPALLTNRLASALTNSARILSLSSAAQAPVDTDALGGKSSIADQFNAYAQSKLALTMWSRSMAQNTKDARVFVAINPGSLLATPMVKEGFGIAGKDISIGSDILVHAALSPEFGNANGQYFDNDKGRFAEPHEDALDDAKCLVVVSSIAETLDSLGHSLQ